MRLVLIIVALLALQAANADTLTVAVASNFRATAETIAEQFTTATGHEVRISSASTSKLYAQIVHGAPFDVFLAADAEHPRLLEDADLGVGASRVTYASGSLVLWSGDPDNSGKDCLAMLGTSDGPRIAIANPKTAPYGRAAQEFLANAELWKIVEPRLVFGENIAQALHFAVTGNAGFALIAKSQAIDSRLPPASCSWPVPTDQHRPIDQQAIVLSRAADRPAASAFLQHLRGAESRATIRQSGYGVP